MAAIFGFQVVLTLVAATILQKLSARYSFGRWLLCRKLYRCLHPSNDVLRTLIGQAQGGKKKGKADRRNHKDETFLLSKQTEIPLITAPITSLDVLQLPYYVEFRWLIDFTCYSLLVYFTSEVFCWFFPVYSAKEINLSVVWIFVTLFMTLKTLTIVTALYFRGMALSGERSLCISFGSVCFLLTMVIFLISDNLLDIGLLEAHENFTQTTADFMEQHDLPSQKERSPILLYFLLSMMFGFLASFLTFPCLRYSKMYQDSLKYAVDDSLARLLIHATFFAPLFVLLLWFRPLARDRLAADENSIMTSAQFESIRLWMCLIPVVLRLLTVRLHLQAYLNLAFDKAADLRKEAGRMSNVDFQKIIVNVFYYLCVVAIQYFAPTILLLSLTFVLKSLGDYAWLDALPAMSTIENWLGEYTPAFLTPILIHTREAVASVSGAESAAAKFLAPSLGHLRTMFNRTVNRGVWSFFLVATSFINFFGSLVGVVYIARFSN